MKCTAVGVLDSTIGPAPQGAGGLKFTLGFVVDVGLQSRPARGGWIEMPETHPLALLSMSRPARGGWIEMPPSPRLIPTLPVPPRKGRVD